MKKDSRKGKQKRKRQRKDWKNSVPKKQEQEERQYNLKIDGKDVADLTGKMVEFARYFNFYRSDGKWSFRHLMCWHRNFDMKP